MGWVWRDDEGEEATVEAERCTTRKVVRSECRTEEVEPGKLVKKCENTEEILRHCIGKPPEVLKSNKVYTEDDVTDLMVKGSSPFGKLQDSPFDFPGLKSDIEDIERHFLGSINRFFDAADSIKSSFFNIFGDFPDGPSSSSSANRRIPIESYPQVEASGKPKESNSGDVDLSTLARDI